MKILRTDGAGFAGHHLSAVLTRRGHRVFLADRFDPAACDQTHPVLYLEDMENIRQRCWMLIGRPAIRHLSNIDKPWLSPFSVDYEIWQRENYYMNRVLEQRAGK